MTGRNQLVMRLHSRYTLEGGCYCTTIDFSLVHHVTHTYLPTKEHLFEERWRYWEATRQDTWEWICHDNIRAWIESQAENCEETLQVRVVRQQTNITKHVPNTIVSAIRTSDSNEDDDNISHTKPKNH